MKIELVAVDIDSTFLRDDKSFDTKRFARIFAHMQAHDIRFVVASGGQLQRLQSYFDEIDDIIFIAENGGWILEGNTELQATTMPLDEVIQLAEDMDKHPHLLTSICGKKSTYVLDTLDDASYKQMQTYCPTLQKIKNFDAIDDEVVKLSIKNRFVAVDEAMSEITPLLTENFAAVPSGNISIDVITPGVHKGQGLAFICEKYGIDPAATVAFGDNENDREMLAFVAQGYVMENAKESLFDVSELRAPSNNEQGVLVVLEELFGIEQHSE